MSLPVAEGLEQVIFKVLSNVTILWFCDNQDFQQISSLSAVMQTLRCVSPHGTPPAVPPPSHHCSTSSPGPDGSRAVDVGFSQRVWIPALRSLFQPLNTAPVLREASCSGFELRAASQSAYALWPWTLQDASSLVWCMEGLQEWAGKLQERRWDISPKISE